MIESIDYILSTIQGYYDSAHVIANTFIGMLLLFEIVFFGIKVALGEVSTVAAFVKKILYIGAWLYLAQNIDSLAIAFVETVSNLPNKLGGEVLDINFMQNPFLILEYAYQSIMLQIVDKFVDLGSVWNILSDINIVVIAFLLILLFLAVGVSFGIITFSILFIQIEFYIVVLCAIFLLPFMVNSHTKFIAEKIMPTITGQGVKLMILAIVSKVVMQVFVHVFDKFYENDEIAVKDMLYVGVIIAVGIYLILQSQTYAQALLSGMPDTNFISQAGKAAAAGLASYKMVQTANTLSKKFDTSSGNKEPNLNKHLANTSSSGTPSSRNGGAQGNSSRSNTNMIGHQPK